MPARPEITLSLSAFPGFDPMTCEALNALFGSASGHGLVALLVRPSGTLNSTRPHEVGFLFDHGDGPVIASRAKAPGGVARAGAAAAYHISHDARIERLFSSMSLACTGPHHDRFAVTAGGAVSWRAPMTPCRKSDEASYQQLTSDGGGMIGYVAAGADRSAHASLVGQGIIGPVASAAYAASIAKLPKPRQVGMHRRITARVGTQVSNKHLHRAC
ncbi:hypothetical protein [uncultured Jannaschia sp.]|uniref:hypothetical protein n=1 Tax=uncultured Jannaschia sp. TaxID=293347 RepID=UPI00260E0F85|nr:hypothetical protein [uncultured Jannaschia sp.]